MGFFLKIVNKGNWDVGFSSAESSATFGHNYLCFMYIENQKQLYHNT